jgi:hypothetical protein
MKGLDNGRLTAALALAFVALLGGRASAQDPPMPPPPAASGPPAVGGAVGYFGERGQIAISGELKFNVLHQSVSKGGGSYTTYEIEPSLDYFVAPNVSVGGLIDLRKDSFPSNSSMTTITIGARAGYNVVLASAVSLWVRGGLSYGHYTVSSTGFPDQTGYSIPLTIYAPLLWHPVPHLFLGVGPFFETDLIAKTGGQSVGKTTDVGLSSTIGGYFGGL